MTRTYRKPYEQAQSPGWWLESRFFTWYMVRESTAILVAAYSVTLIFGLFRLTQGQVQWQAWLDTLRSPWALVFHSLALLAALYHAYTWFKLAPKIIVLRLGGRTLPPGVMLYGQWLGLFGCSALLFALFLFAGVSA